MDKRTRIVEKLPDDLKSGDVVSSADLVFLPEPLAVHNNPQVSRPWTLADFAPTSCAKITRINSKVGLASPAEDAAFDHRGALLFPEATDNDRWAVYLPLHGTREPFYSWKTFTENDIAHIGDRCLFVLYLDSDLVPKLSPKEEEQIWRDAVREVQDRETFADEHRDYIEVVKAIVNADSQFFAAIDSTVGHALQTWTCERGCGYEGNAAESNVCEVCGRGKGD